MHQTITSFPCNVPHGGVQFTDQSIRRLKNRLSIRKVQSHGVTKLLGRPRHLDAQHDSKDGSGLAEKSIAASLFVDSLVGVFATPLLDRTTWHWVH